MATLFALSLVLGAQAQALESIWLTADTTDYKTGDTVRVALNASSATAIQGFTFQIRYDPACLRPVNASSPIPGMNGLALPQLTGLVDGSYASTSPQLINGVLAEVRFTALKGCQTGLTLESAALAIRSAEGFAVPLSNILVGERNIGLNIDDEVGAAQPSQPESGSILSLEPPNDTDQGIPAWWLIGAALFALFGLLLIGAYKKIRGGMSNKSKTVKRLPGTLKPTLQINQGPQAGQSYALNKFPIKIGRDPQNDISINGPSVLGTHAQIFAERNGYYLRDLGGETFINGRPVKGSAVVLYPGDVVRLGKSASFVFGERRLAEQFASDSV
jgi:hypothetical protein